MILLIEITLIRAQKASDEETRWKINARININKHSLHRVEANNSTGISKVYSSSTVQFPYSIFINNKKLIHIYSGGCSIKFTYILIFSSIQKSHKLKYLIFVSKYIAHYHSIVVYINHCIYISEFSTASFAFFWNLSSICNLFLFLYRNCICQHCNKRFVMHKCNVMLVAGRWYVEQKN